MSLITLGHIHIPKVASFAGSGGLCRQRSSLQVSGSMGVALSKEDIGGGGPG